MNYKWLRWYEAQYLKALAYAQVYDCDLSIEQFCAAHVLEADELEQLRPALIEGVVVGVGSEHGGSSVIPTVECATVSSWSREPSENGSLPTVGVAA